MFIFKKDKYGTYPIPIKSKDGKVDFTIYLTQEQVDNIGSKGNFTISYRKIEKLKEIAADGTRAYYIAPTIAFTPGKDGTINRLHLGNYLYPELKGIWSETIWKDRAWDFSPSNLNIGPDQTRPCKGCGKWSEKKSQFCSPCIYLNTLIGFNVTELAKVGLKSTLTENSSLWGTVNCDISGIPMIFEANSGLRAPSVYRLDKTIGLTDSNTKLVLTGLNQLRSSSTPEEFKMYLSLTDTKAGEDVKITDMVERKLNLLLSYIKDRSRKRGQKSDIKIENICDLLIETKGICKITNVPLDLQFSGPRSIFNPSIDRIDPSVGYFKGNVQIISLGANLMKGEMKGNEECKKFYREALEGIGRKGGIDKIL